MLSVNELNVYTQFQLYHFLPEPRISGVFGIQNDYFNILEPSGEGVGAFLGVHFSCGGGDINACSNLPSFARYVNPFSEL